MRDVNEGESNLNNNMIIYICKIRYSEKIGWGSEISGFILLGRKWMLENFPKLGWLKERIYQVYFL